MRASVSLFLAAFLALSPVNTAFAEVPTSDEVLAQQTEMLSQKLCSKTSGKSRSSCISSIIKQIKIMKKEFAEALRIERNAWDDAHGHLGLSKERETLFQEYLKEVQAKRALFTKQDHLLQKQFFGEQETARFASSSSRSSNASASATYSSAATKCGNETDPGKMRVCMRANIRLSNAVKNRIPASSSATSR